MGSKRTYPPLPDPTLFRFDMDCPDHALGLAPVLVIGDRCPHDDLATGNRRATVDEIISLCHGAQAFEQRDLTIAPEITARPAGQRVYRDQARLDRRFQDPGLARAPPRGIPVISQDSAGSKRNTPTVRCGIATPPPPAPRD